MYVRDIMTTNVVTIPADTSIIIAKRIMAENKFRRLPVVDNGKLAGIVTEQMLEKVAPPETTSSSIWELSYTLVSLYKMHVKEIMRKDVVTATPDMTVEESLTIAQSNKVGALVVVEDDKVVGIVTTNDFFYKIVNPILGLGEPGTRVEVAEAGDGKALEEVISTVNKHGLKITTLHVLASSEAVRKDVVIHVDSENVSQLVTELEGKGYKVSLRRR